MPGITISRWERVYQLLDDPYLLPKDEKGLRTNDGMCTFWEILMNVVSSEEKEAFYALSDKIVKAFFNEGEFLLHRSGGLDDIQFLRLVGVIASDKTPLRKRTVSETLSSS